MLIDAVLATARARPRRRTAVVTTSGTAMSTLREAVVTARSTSGAHSPRLIAIGASTGGTEAIRRVLEQLPADCPPIVIVQHIPGAFSGAFADHLNELCRMDVQEARDGDRLRRGLALVAPGDEHMRVIGRGEQLKVRLDRSPPVSRHRPSVDVLFESIAQTGLPGATAVLLTGMGEDGAAGMLAMRSAGMRTIAQDEASSVVYGMPKEAAARGAVERVLPLNSIARELMEPRGRKEKL
jgi:two-component system chemotaxis response regulator CheB